VLVGLVAVVLFTGTVVTGTGPHSGGGTRDNIARLDLRLESVARVHGTMVMIFLAAVLLMMWLVRRDRAPRQVHTWVTILLVVLVAQAGIGYWQYLTDIPALLVGIHIAGATAVFTATLCLYLFLFEREARIPAPASPVSSSEGVLTAS
jgi:cytochrome c oxidase assembly protein subunit 15